MTPAATDVPCRFTLTTAGLTKLAAASGTPLPWPDHRGGVDLAARLGAPAHAGSAQSASDPLAELAGLGLLAGDGPHPVVAAALRVFAEPEAVVDLDVAIGRARSARGFEQLHAWHRVAGDRVTSLSYAGGDTFELGWFGVRWWRSALARLVPPPPSTTRAAPRPGLDLPHSVWLASGGALHTHRDDVLPELAGRHAGRVRDSAGALSVGECAEQLRLVHRGVLGRAQAVAAGQRRGRRRLGLLSWLLYADGWRELTPRSVGTERRIALTVVESSRFGAQVARLVHGVRAR